MVKPTGRLKLVYQTIANMEVRIEDLESEYSNYVKQMTSDIQELEDQVAELQHYKDQAVSDHHAEEAGVGDI